MSFVSYAQNFEDLMLWRALRHVAGGLYVDVGAQHPRTDSVSRGFYEQGWRGVHVEPVRQFADLLRADRPDETVLEVALSDVPGTLALNVFPDTGLSTAVARHADSHVQAYALPHRRVEVPMLTLATALGALAGRQVHWLKIDVEGYEEQVLRGWDSKVLRPWVMVIEATVPGSTEPDYAHWDPIVVAAGYRFVYFDGLNRFYVAEEHAELAAAFGTPPNVFDDVTLSGQASWGLCRRIQAGAEQALAGVASELAASRDQVRLLEQEAAAARSAGAEWQAASDRWWREADRLSGELAAMHASGSWRLLMRVARVRGWLRRAARALLRPALPPVLVLLRGVPPLGRVALRLLAPWPGRKARLQARLAPAAAAAPAAAPAPGAADGTDAMTPGAARHYLRLQQALREKEDACAS